MFRYFLTKTTGEKLRVDDFFAGGSFAGIAWLACAEAPPMKWGGSRASLGISGSTKF